MLDEECTIVDRFRALGFARRCVPKRVIRFRGDFMRSGITKALIAVALLTGGCASGATPAGTSVSAFDTPTTATLSWFAAVNHKDLQAALAHFEADSAHMADWSGGPSSWPTFSSVQCQPESETKSDARVSCTFQESDAPAVGNPDSWWDVYLRQQEDGRWLIDNYGQG